MRIASLPMLLVVRVLRVVLGVMLRVMTRGVLVVLGRVQMVSVRHVRVVRGLVVVAGDVRLVRFPVMMRRRLVVQGGVFVVLMR